MKTWVDRTRNKRTESAGWFIVGVAMTLFIALIAKFAAGWPYLSIMGQLVLAILMGMIWRAAFDVNERLQAGISFSSSKLLRMGIILLGMRLNLADIYHAGVNVIVISVIYLVVALFLVYGLTRWFGVDSKLGILTASGTAICGAAAVVAMAPQIKANKEQTAVAVATVAVLGTIFTILYTLLASVLHLASEEYGLFAGATLHEIAHVIAAAAPAGDAAVDIAVIVKLTRVALLIPVALIIGAVARSKDTNREKNKFSFSSVPWFIFGFLAMSGLNTLDIVSEHIAAALVSIAYLLMGMAMAGLGLNVQFQTFRKLGIRPFVAGLIGSTILSVMGYGLVILFR